MIGSHEVVHRASSFVVWSSTFAWCATFKLGLGHESAFHVRCFMLSGTRGALRRERNGVGKSKGDGAIIARLVA